MYYNKKGEKIELMEWAKLLEDNNYKVIKQETLPDGTGVSTVWLGLDHQFGKGKPLIFETMVFSKYYKKYSFRGKEYKSRDSLDMERYSTLKEAREGHKKMVEKWLK